MKNNLLFDFTVDKTANTVYVNREFSAKLSLVWDAFTKQEILDQWWAPKPWLSKTKYMNFRVGGRRFYAMVSPEGQSIGLFRAILKFHQKQISKPLMLSLTRTKTSIQISQLRNGT